MWTMSKDEICEMEDNPSNLNENLEEYCKLRMVGEEYCISNDKYKKIIDNKE